jgi:formate/nitrite transporter FocA (FNT family)
MSEDLSGKIIGVWITVGCFTATGWEHCIANMFYIPLGVMIGSKASYAQFIYKNLIPATIGNIIGGGVFLGLVQWYLYYAGDSSAPESKERKDFKWTKITWLNSSDE